MKKKYSDMADIDSSTKSKSAREEFINSRGGNKSLREKIWDFCSERDLALKLFEPGCFDGGIIRWGQEGDGFVVVYDYEKTAEALAEDYLAYNDSTTNKDKIDEYGFDEAYMDAVEWIDYNTIRSIPYMGPGAPKVVYTDEDGVEQIV